MFLWLVGVCVWIFPFFFLVRRGLTHLGVPHAQLPLQRLHHQAQGPCIVELVVEGGAAVAVAGGLAAGGGEGERAWVGLFPDEGLPEGCVGVWCVCLEIRGRGFWCVCVWKLGVGEGGKGGTKLKKWIIHIYIFICEMTYGHNTHTHGHTTTHIPGLKGAMRANLSSRCR